MTKIIKTPGASLLWLQWSMYIDPLHLHPHRLQAAAMMKFELMKEQTTSGLAHVIEQHKYTDITVDLQPCHLIVPDQGLYRR